jgi:hypothetical protein
MSCENRNMIRAIPDYRFRTCLNVLLYVSKNYYMSNLIWDYCCLSCAKGLT